MEDGGERGGHIRRGDGGLGVCSLVLIRSLSAEEGNHVWDGLQRERASMSGCGEEDTRLK